MAVLYATLAHVDAGLSNPDAAGPFQPDAASVLPLLSYFRLKGGNWNLAYNKSPFDIPWHDVSLLLLSMHDG
jgi:hypothetical protein